MLRADGSEGGWKAPERRLGWEQNSQNVCNLESQVEGGAYEEHEKSETEPEQPGGTARQKQASQEGRKQAGPWLVWLSGLSAGLWTRSPLGGIREATD